MVKQKDKKQEDEECNNRLWGNIIAFILVAIVCFVAYNHYM